MQLTGEVDDADLLERYLMPKARYSASQASWWGMTKWTETSSAMTGPNMLA